MTHDRRELAALCLVFEAGLALLAAFGLLTYARLSNALAGLAGQELVALGGVALLLVFALGVGCDLRLALSARLAGKRSRSWVPAFRLC